MCSRKIVPWAIDAKSAWGGSTTSPPAGPLVYRVAVKCKRCSARGCSDSRAIVSLKRAPDTTTGVRRHPMAAAARARPDMMQGVRVPRLATQHETLTGNLAGATFRFQTDAPDLAEYARMHLAPLMDGAVTT